MGKQSLTAKIKETIGAVAWRVFLWSNGWTDEQYQELRDEDVLRLLDTCPVAETKVDDDEQLWVRLEENQLEERGSVRLLHSPTSQ